MEAFMDRVAAVKVNGWKKDNGCFVEYCLTVRLKNGFYFHIEKRYNDFRVLFDDLQSHTDAFSFELPFPPKQRLFHSQSCLLARATYFQLFIDFCVSVEEFSGKVSKFFRVPVKFVESIDDVQSSTDVISSTLLGTRAASIGDDSMASNTANDLLSSASLRMATQAKKPQALRNKRGSIYFKNLMDETDIDSILQKQELTDDELLLLSRRQATNPRDVSSTVCVLFKMTAQELQGVFAFLTGGGCSHGMSLEQFMAWDEIQTVVASGNLSEADIKYRFSLFIDQGQFGLSARNFQLLVNQLDSMGTKEKHRRSSLHAQVGELMSAEVASLLRSILIAHYLFDALTSDDIAGLIARMQLLTVGEGQHIVRQDDFGDLFYCIEQGGAKATVAGVGDVRTYAAGDCFGELALIHDCPRSSTVTATQQCRLWTLSLRSFRSVAISSSSKKIDRRREASSAKKKISRRGSIVRVPENDVALGGQQDIAACKHTPAGHGASEMDVAHDDSHIPDEIKSTYLELARESGGEGVSLTAIVSWSVMQDAIQCAFMSEVVMWTEYLNFISEGNNMSTRPSLAGSTLLDLEAFFQFCIRLQKIIDTNIDMMESIA